MQSDSADVRERAGRRRCWPCGCAQVGFHGAIKSGPEPGPMLRRYRHNSGHIYIYIYIYRCMYIYINISEAGLSPPSLSVSLKVKFIIGTYYCNRSILHVISSSGDLLSEDSLLRPFCWRVCQEATKFNSSSFSVNSTRMSDMSDMAWRILE
jgi:hypothetical protein